MICSDLSVDGIGWIPPPNRAIHVQYLNGPGTGPADGVLTNGKLKSPTTDESLCGLFMSFSFCFAAAGSMGMGGDGIECVYIHIYRSVVVYLHT